MEAMSRPQLSYTIWFSQRTGSSLLCDALTLTGIAGKPNEWLSPEDEQNLLEFDISTLVEFQKRLWILGSSNDIFGLKVGIHEPFFSNFISIFRRLPECSKPNLLRAEVWNCVFPNHHHIFMTRRNKVRLAVSWWKAIQTQQWHRQGNEPISA